MTGAPSVIASSRMRICRAENTKRMGADWLVGKDVAPLLAWALGSGCDRNCLLTRGSSVSAICDFATLIAQEPKAHYPRVVLSPVLLQKGKDPSAAEESP